MSLNKAAMAKQIEALSSEMEDLRKKMAETQKPPYYKRVARAYYLSTIGFTG
jgi:hypothetical protein